MCTYCIIDFTLYCLLYCILYCILNCELYCTLLCTQAPNRGSKYHRLTVVRRRKNMRSLRKTLRLYMQTREIMIFILVSQTFCLFVPTLGACIEVFYPFFCAKLAQLNSDSVKKSTFRMSGTPVASGTDFNNKEK